VSTSTLANVRVSRRRLVACGLTAAAAVAATVARAVDGFEFSIAAIDGSQWHASDIRLEFDFLDAGQRARLVIASFRLPGAPEPIRNVRIDCASVDMSPTVVACRDGQVTADIPGLGQQRFWAALTYGRADASLEVSIRNWRLGDGELALVAAFRNDAWQAAAELDEVGLPEVLRIAAAFDIALPVSATSGRATAKLQAQGREAQPVRVAASGEVVALSINNESGSLASEQLAFNFTAQAQREGHAWRYAVEIDAPSGQAYAEPFFLDFGVHPLAASVTGLLTDDGALVAERFEIEHADVLTATGAALLRLKHEQPLRELSVDLERLQFPGAYDSYLQPLLLDTNFRSVQTSGALAGTITVRDGAAEQVAVSLDALSLDGPDLRISELSGALSWRMQAQPDAADTQSAPAPAVSTLRWASGALFGLDFGASELRFTLDQRNVRLLEPVRIPFLDGALKLDSLRIRNAGLPTVAFLIDATLEPVSVPRLCQAFGWPEFGGHVGGTISKLRMREGVVTLGTTLEAQVFDGQVRVSDLRLEQPFSNWPRFHSNIELENLDLELVTGAFSFGRITGRLSGAIRDLEMFNWSPVAFDARLFTPPHDRSRRRISQRAVENIGSMGGGGAGVTAALSSGFLRFFDDFNYQRLGISCRLRNEVCEMDGAAPAPNGGYYLVEGRGVPRIDVIGNSRRVDWPRLVQQLIDATQSSGPVVQ
jgi:hypothetical protein